MVYSVQEFASKIRTKFPQYKWINDIDLAKEVIRMHPEYKDQVKFPSALSQTAIGKNFTSKMERINSYKPDFNNFNEQLNAPAPTAEQVGIRKSPQDVKSAISSRFKSKAPGNQDVENIGNLAWDVWQFWQGTLNLISAGAWDLVTWLWNIRKQIESEWYMKTWSDMYQWIKNVLPGAIKTWKDAIAGDKLAQNKIIEFISKYPDIIVPSIVWLQKLPWQVASFTKNLPKNIQTAKTLIKNPSANIIDDMWNPTGETVSARQIAGDFIDRKFNQGAESFLAQHWPSPYAIKWNTQAQGRQWRPNQDPGQPTAWTPTPPPPTEGPWWQGLNFDYPWKAKTQWQTNFSNFDNTLRGKTTKIAEKFWDKIWGAVDTVTWPIAQAVTKNKTWLQKIYSAVWPRFNKLAWKNTASIAKMEKHIGTIGAIWIQMGIVPQSLTDFVDMTNHIISQMGEWVQQKLWKPIKVDMSYVADKLQNYIDEKSKSWIVTDKPWLDKLREQVDMFKQMGEVDPMIANIIKQELNERANRDDTDLAQITKNGYKNSSIALWDALSTLLSDLPGEFRYYKETMWAWLAIMDDLIKSLVQEKKKNTNGIIESFGRVSWLWDFFAWLISLSPGRVASGLWQFVIWESFGKLKNKDRLIQEWFKQLYQEAWIPMPKQPFQPKTSNYADKWQAWITDTQIMKDASGWKNYNDFIATKTSKIDAENRVKAEAKAKQDRMIQREKEQQQMKKDKIETQKRRFDSAIKSWQYDLIEIGRIPPKKWDLTEFYGEIQKTVVDRGNIKIDAEDADGMTIYEVGKIARKKYNDPKPTNTDIEPKDPTPTDDWWTPDAWSDIIQTKWYKQEEYKKSAEDMLWTSLDSLDDEWQKLFMKAVNSTKTENRLALVDELLFNYATPDAKADYIMEITKDWNQKDIQDTIDNLKKYWFWKQNQYTSDEFDMAMSYLKGLLDTKDMDQPSLFSIPQNEWKTAQGAPTEKLQDSTEIRSNKEPVDSNSNGSNKIYESKGNWWVSQWDWSSNWWGIVSKIKTQPNTIIGRFTNALLSIVESNWWMKDWHLKVGKDWDAMMPFVIEEIWGNKIAVSHYYIQEWDVMYDPEVIFNVNQDGSLDAVSIMNSWDWWIERPIKNTDWFLDTWGRNIEHYINAEYYRKPKVDQWFEDSKKYFSDKGGVLTVKPNNQLKFNQWDSYEPVRLVVNDKDAMVARFWALANKQKQSIVGKWTKLTDWERLEMKRILNELWVDEKTAIERHQFLKDEAKKVRSSSEQVLHEINDDFRTKMEAKEADIWEYKQPIVNKGTTFYHATNKDFKDFDLSKSWSNTERNNARFGIFFSDDLKAVKTFADENVWKDHIIKEVNLDIKNPLDFTIEGLFYNEAQAPTILKILWMDEGHTPKEALELINEEIDFTNIDELFEGIFSDIANKQIMIDAWYDGIISQFGKWENSEVIREYAVFDPKQITIKSNEKPLFAPAKDKPVVQKFTAKSKVWDSTQTATIKDGKITVTNRDGRNIVLEYDIPLSEWENALKPWFWDNSFNIESNITKLLKDKNTDRWREAENNPEYHSFYSRIADWQRTAIKQAYKSYKDSMDPMKQLEPEFDKFIGSLEKVKWETPLETPTPLLSPESKTLSKQKKDDIQKTAVEILEKKNYSMDVADYTTEEVQLFKTYSGVSWLTSEAWVLDQFYTPSIVIKSMWNLVWKYHDWPVQLALEPASWIWRIALVGPEWIKYDMFEIDKTAGTIAQILNQDSKVTIGDFQDIFMNGRKPKSGYEWKYYDIAISNPPYKDRQTMQRGLWELPEFNRFEDYFTYRQLQMVKPWWLVVTIVPSAFLDKWAYQAKQMIASIWKLIDAYRLPNGTFPDTAIWTDILVFKKEPGNINDIIDKNFFKNNPDKILWEEKQITDQYGKPAIKVIGEKDAVTKIIWQTPKTIKNYSTTPSKPKPQEWLFANATPNVAPVKKPEMNKPILAKKQEQFETQTITMGNPDPKLLQYQKDTDVLWHLIDYTIDDIATDPNWLNYMNGKIYSNYNYLQGNIREKLDDLERNYTGWKITKDIYDRQKSKLKAILPEDVSIMDIMFSPFDQKLVNMPTWETKSQWQYQDGRQVKVQLPITVWDLFRSWLNENKPTSISSDNYQIKLIMQGKVAKWDAEIKNQIQMDAQKAFSDFMIEALPSKLQEELVQDYNYTYNSYVKPDNKSQPFVIDKVWVNFKNWHFKLTNTQIEWINHLTNKWAWMIAYWVWVGKTITGLWATVLAMQKWWTKRPLFIVPKATLQHTWIGTISKLFPTYNIVNLWWLGVPDIKRLEKQYWTDPSKWIQDWDIAITTFQWMKNLTLKPENELAVTQDLTDVMWNQTETAKKAQAQAEKINMETWKLLKTSWKNEIFLEDLWIDHITIDEVHNMKNIFQSAEVRKEEWEFNPFGAVLKWSSSDVWRKAYMIAQHIMRNNNNRWVYALSATPFNNQPIEVYNLLALMAKKRLEQMGIKNINDFFTTFSYIQEELVPSSKHFGEMVYKPTMKSFSNVQELQKLTTEFIDYKDANTAETMMKRPDKVSVKHVVKNTNLQREVTTNIREWLAENENEKWAPMTAMMQSILNATSPHFVNRKFSWIAPATSGKELFDWSEKLQVALALTKATLESGKWHVFWFMEQWVTYHPMIVQHIQESLGLKKWEVAYISWSITQDKKDDIADWFRKWTVKVLVWWTTTAEWIDLQDFWVLTIHVSLNRNPTKTVQSWWRIRRPGNLRNQVYEAFLLTEDSGDIWYMQKYEEKSSRINDLFSYQGRVFEDPTMTDWEAKMALMTDPIAKAKQQIQMDKWEIVNQSKRKHDLSERNSTKLKLLNEESRTIDYVQKYIEDLERSLRDWTIREYQKEQLEDYRKSLIRSKNKIKELIKKHDTDYSELPMDEAVEKIMVDLWEKNKRLLEEQNMLDQQAKDIEKKLPEYETYFIEEQKRIDSLKKTMEQQIDEYKEWFLKNVKFMWTVGS
jgi:hypothetical protein